MLTDIAAPEPIEEPCEREPEVMVRWSDDGGHVWSNERRATIGQVGDFEHRVVLRRLGVARDRVYEIKVTDPVAVRFISAFIATASANS